MFSVLQMLVFLLYENHRLCPQLFWFSHDAAALLLHLLPAQFYLKQSYTVLFPAHFDSSHHLPSVFSYLNQLFQTFFDHSAF